MIHCVQNLAISQNECVFVSYINDEQVIHWLDGSNEIVWSVHHNQRLFSNISPVPVSSIRIVHKLNDFMRMINTQMKSLRISLILRTNGSVGTEQLSIQTFFENLGKWIRQPYTLWEYEKFKTFWKNEVPGNLQFTLN